MEWAIWRYQGLSFRVPNREGDDQTLLCQGFHALDHAIMALPRHIEDAYRTLGGQCFVNHGDAVLAYPGGGRLVQVRWYPVPIGVLPWNKG